MSRRKPRNAVVGRELVQDVLVASGRGFTDADLVARDKVGLGEVDAGGGKVPRDARDVARGEGPDGEAGVPQFLEALGQARPGLQGLVRGQQELAVLVGTQLARLLDARLPQGPVEDAPEHGPVHLVVARQAQVCVLLLAGLHPGVAEHARADAELPQPVADAGLDGFVECFIGDTCTWVVGEYS